MLDNVVPALGAAQMRQLGPTVHGRSYWGTSRLIEIVGVPMELGRLAELTLPPEGKPCRWCSEPIASLPCPFCGESAGRPSGRTGTLHPGQTSATGASVPGSTSDRG